MNTDLDLAVIGDSSNYDNFITTETSRGSPIERRECRFCKRLVRSCDFIDEDFIAPCHCEDEEERRSYPRKAQSWKYTHRSCLDEFRAANKNNKAFYKCIDCGFRYKFQLVTDLVTPKQSFHKWVFYDFLIAILILGAPLLALSFIFQSFDPALKFAQTFNSSLFDSGNIFPYVQMAAIAEAFILLTVLSAECSTAPWCGLYTRHYYYGGYRNYRYDIRRRPWSWIWCPCGCFCRKGTRYGGKTTVLVIFVTFLLVCILALLLMTWYMAIVLERNNKFRQKTELVRLYRVVDQQNSDVITNSELQGGNSGSSPATHLQPSEFDSTAPLTSPKPHELSTLAEEIVRNVGLNWAVLNP